MMTLEPLLSDWNYRLMQLLFHVVRHRGSTDTVADFIVSNHLASTWIFGASFYLLWIIDDDRRLWRRMRLFQIVVGVTIAVLISMVVRPWIAWPAPALSPRFRVLY